MRESENHHRRAGHQKAPLNTFQIIRHRTGLDLKLSKTTPKRRFTMPTINMTSARHVHSTGQQLSFTSDDATATGFFTFFDANYNNILNEDEPLEIYSRGYQFKGTFDHNGNQFFPSIICLMVVHGCSHPRPTLNWIIHSRIGMATSP